jgi:thioesterase domain-containing protein
MAELVGRLSARRAKGGLGADTARDGAPGGADLEEIEARWLAAAVQLREIAEIDPERRQAMERFKSEANEETWRGAHRLLVCRGLSND